eukprot:m.105665 g.105665  ORF g.105665 m.105665 type:complete len:97 (+) comp10557_c0_seq1:100-390(+)
MEGSIESALEKSISQDGVSGILACDTEGLCLTTQGDLSGAVSGYMSTLVTRAKMLHPTATAPPVVCIESDKSKIVIQQNDTITLAVKQTNRDDATS